MDKVSSETTAVSSDTATTKRLRRNTKPPETPQTATETTRPSKRMRIRGRAQKLFAEVVLSDHDDVDLVSSEIEEVPVPKRGKKTSKTAVISVKV